jgi:hypothetical protein
LRNENESISNAEKKACNVIHSLQLQVVNIYMTKVFYFFYNSIILLYQSLLVNLVTT